MLELLLMANASIKTDAVVPIRDSYDYILIDCPPSLGMLTINAFTACDTILIPVQSEYYALEGLSQLLNTIQLVQKHFNPNLKIEGVLLTMLDARTNLGNEVVEEVKRFFKDKVYQTIIPRNVRLSEAPSHGVIVLCVNQDKLAAKRPPSGMVLTREHFRCEREAVKKTTEGNASFGCNEDEIVSRNTVLGINYYIVCGTFQ